MDFVSLNSDQMTRTTPDLASSPPNFRTTPAGGSLTLDVRFNVHTRRTYGGFKPQALPCRSQDLTTKPPPLILESMYYHPKPKGTSICCPIRICMLYYLAFSKSNTIPIV
ncbi:hypothetical protein AVEN_2829-1 [Araneus ventricosus]|uniref:Uncharacterized protein n=1 Tax=Araneus ventricosus TaxID=182803 RepID=A0A4Y2EJH1_ARAVE|nr:hypothetical protein AVEN_2829-1 [Araneus ventricosus]